MTGITILGATGTIGMNTLDVIKQHRHEFEVIALTAHRDVDQLAAQCVEWQPRYAVMADETAAERLQQRLKTIHPDIQVLSGVDGLIHVSRLPEVDIVMAAIVGSAGLLPTLAAAQAGKRVLLANKESLVMSGPLFMEAVRDYGAQILPIDSEHNAVFQCMPPSFRIPSHSWIPPTSVYSSRSILCGDRGSFSTTAPFEGGLQELGVNRILLTASGGPFRGYSREQLHDVTPAQACAHPNWVMGRKISVDSATMMNKGLEVIEACWLFSTMPDRVDVVLHPQSVIHSLVEYIDGSVLAQLGNPDMRTPIAYALAWPKRMTSGVTRLNLVDIAHLDFEEVDFGRFPCLQLAYEAMLAGGSTTTILNAANEVAVQAFLEGRLRFTEIPLVIETTLSLMHGRDVVNLNIVLEDDAQARQLAEGSIAKLAHTLISL
ncbi:MAG: 1-deoxy-D-xylulose-5-phosphate reductoisomerase [Beggiatoa sp. IS2]|nr:MAG: 1-deoxy-D-xylulose-5-phosphate reductoisomerase [Beggiatoa sp. IS2]